MTRAEEIAAALNDVRATIDAAAQRSGRTADAVRLIAVSKKMPAADVVAALAAGQRDFGENYAQELRDKRAELNNAGSSSGAPTPEWHYLGPIQRNKVKYLAGQVALIQSVDDLEILGEIDARTAAVSIKPTGRQACLVQVNVAGENRKGGVPPHRLSALLDRFATATHVTCQGLMLIPPVESDGDKTRRHFAALRGLAEQEARVERANVTLTQLSMGMSGDFAEAIAEGATMVRVGTAIFGQRTPR
jgi:pyridoxal phosphate enzyme (YggS family)